MSPQINEKKTREKLVKKYVVQLSKKVGRTQEELLSIGLLCTDFNSDLFLEYEDGSTSNYHNAFYVENEQYYCVFTEHCSYHEYPKEWLNSIEQYNDSSRQEKEKLARVKWAGTHTPYVSLERTDERIYPTKRELVAMRDELDEFIKYYHESFQPHTIDLEDEFDDEDSLTDPSLD